MAINKKLIHFKSKSQFERELANNNILPTSICFIQDSREIWTHNEFYDCSGGGSIGEVAIKLTYEELFDLRSQRKLIPGMFYRITDYEAMTKQSNTRNAGNGFDIIIQALDNNILSEDARAIHRDGDVYFQNNNLAAWDIKYSFDNNSKWTVSNDVGQSQKWVTSWGILGENYENKNEAENYTTVEIDGSTKYLYRPNNPNNYLENKEFFKLIYSHDITNVNNLIFESEYSPYEEDSGGESDDSYGGNWYWGDVYTMDVKDSEGNLLATLSSAGDGIFYDDKDIDSAYPICFDPNCEWTDNETYLYFIESGGDEWFENMHGGKFPTYTKEVYTGSKESLYYALNNPLKKGSRVYVDNAYSESENCLLATNGSIDFVTYYGYLEPYWSGYKGVIYYLKDEFGNSAPYDFKNIQFKYNDAWYYTFTNNGTNIDRSLSNTVSNNRINKLTLNNTLPTVIFASSNSNNIKDNVLDVAVNQMVITTSGATTANRWESSQVNTSSTVFNKFIVNASAFEGNTFKGFVYEMYINTSSTSSAWSQNNVKLLQTYVNEAFIYNINSRLFKCEVDFRTMPCPLTIASGTFLNCIIEGHCADTTTLAILNAPNTFYSSRIRFTNSLNITYGDTTSTAKRLTNVYLNALYWPSGTTVDIPTSFPVNSSYEWNVAMNSDGVIKQWCAADLIA